MGIEAEVFGRDGDYAIKIVRTLLPLLRGTGRDWPEDVFRDIAAKSPDKAKRIYWVELLGRAYVASATCLRRNDQWIGGMVGAYASSSYLGFCGCLRGLLESSADSMFSLEAVAPTLATNWSSICQILRDEKGSQWVICQELEDLLIHFVYAKKTKKFDGAPDNHKARTNRDYIDVIKRFDSSIENLYCELCELAHPAEASVEWMMKTRQVENHYVTSLLAPEEASTQICRMLDKHRNTITNLLMAGTNYSLLTLKTLSRFPIEGIKLDFMNSVDLSGIPAWMDIDRMTRP